MIKKPRGEKQEIRVQNDKILIDGELDAPEVTTPAPKDLFLSSEEQKEVEELSVKIKQTEPTTVKHSEFVGLSLKVHSTHEVNVAYKAIAQRFSAMDHIMVGYALKEKGQIKMGHCDDGEFAGGSRIRKIMAEEQVKNTAVFVVRQYGGIHLGFNWFQIIENVTREACKLLQS